MKFFSKLGCLLSIIILIIIDNTFLGNGIINGVKPDLLLVWIVCLSIFVETIEIYVIAFLSGLLYDFYVDRFIGAMALSLLTTVFLLKKFIKRSLSESILMAFLIVVVGTVFNAVIYDALLVFSGAAFHIDLMVIVNLLLQVFLNTIVVLLIFPLVSLGNKIFGGKSK